MSARGTFIQSGLLVLALGGAPRIGIANEERDSACAGEHSLWSPVPDACLGAIDTDRPHQTDTPHVVPAGHFQLESAIAALQIASPSHLLFVENAYKVGLVTGVDLQLILKLVDYVPDRRRLDAPGPLSVRVKLNLVEERGWIPAITLVPWIFVPLSSSEALRGGPLVFWGWELPFDLELEMNAGALFSKSPNPAVAIVLASALTCTVSGTFRVFIDGYATGSNVALGTGALWAFARDVQIDVGTYVGLHGDEPTATPFVGFSFRR